MEPTILVVDDHAFNRLIYGDWLRQLHGVGIVEAATAELGLQLAAQHEFALHVVDVALEGSSGFEFVRRLHALPGRERAPVLLVTSAGFERRYQAQGYEAGAAAFVASATSRGSVLLHKAGVFIDWWRQRKELEAQVRDLRRQLDESERSIRALRTHATHESLTRLPNRALFRDRLQAACARANRARSMFAVAYVDLDDFKGVNDRHGHAAGDALLVTVAGRLTRAVRASDTVARLAGDEFGLLLEGIDGVGGAESVGRKLYRSLMQPAELTLPEGKDKITVQGSGSVGIAIYPDHGTQPDRLVFRADLAMYAAKESDGLRIYGDDLMEELASGGPELIRRGEPRTVPQRH